MSKAEIIAALEKIHQLEKMIEARIIAGFKPVLDEHGKELTPANIQERIERLAAELMADTSVERPILISLMNGALPFASALQKILAERGYSFQFDTMQVSSYAGTESGFLSIKTMPKIPVGVKHVIVVDDVCDTGKTYAALQKFLLSQGASSVKLMALVNKAQARPSEAEPTYAGVAIPKDAFIAGMGMDYDELLRNVPGIGAVDPATLPTAAEKEILAQKVSLNRELQACLAIERAQRGSLAAYPGSMFGASGAAATVELGAEPALDTRPVG